ncbi:MAG: tetratricopeptide repeat protein [Actinomycetota bacterium]
MARRAFVSRFSPNRTDPEVLEAIFVQRHHLAEVWLERLRESVLTGARHHLLAVGPRGCGKSHLVVLLLHRLRQDPAINERARIAWLPEDETTPSFWKFLLRILRALEATYGDEFPPPPRERLARATDADRTAVLTDYLLEKLDDRVLLVVVENLDDVMRGLGAEGQKRWRAFLQEHRVAATLATAQQLTKDLSDRDKPFFNFFQIERLKPLSSDEALSLLRKLADQSGNAELAAFLQSPVGRARIRAIRHLTGGSHRIFIILSEFATRENLDDLVSAFEELLDELTPYYQERLRWLPDQQREIVEFLCRQSQTVTVKKIATELFLSEPAAAAQLKGLRDKGYVTAASVGRESRYELAEPLMRICVEVKDPQREPIRLIVQFLRVWYDQESVHARLGCLPAGAKLERRYFHAALQAHDSLEPDPLDEALNRDIDAARAADDTEALVQLLTDRGATSRAPYICYSAAKELFHLARFAEALIIWERTIELAPGNSMAWSNKGATLSRLRQPEAALLAYHYALKFEPENSVAWTNKGRDLANLDRLGEALAATNRALALDSSDPNSWSTKGDVLLRLGRYSEALSAYDQLIELQAVSYQTTCDRRFILAKLGRYVEVIDECSHAIAASPDDPLAYEDRGHARLGLGQVQEAVQDFERALDLYSFLPGAIEGLALASLLQGDWDDVKCALSKRFRLPTSGKTNLWQLPTFLTTLLRMSPDAAAMRTQMASLIKLAEAVYTEQRQKDADWDSASAGDFSVGRVDPFVLLGNALVRSLQEQAYLHTSDETLKEWEALWHGAVEQHPDLAVSVRLFSIGLRYIKTNDERILLDLVQEERAILRELFGLDEANE